MIPITSAPHLECPLDPRPCAGVRSGTTLVALDGLRRERSYAAPTTLAEALVLLAEAEDTLAAIAAGDVDAVVVADDVTRRVFALTTADRTYRMFVENMREGAATVSADGLVVYANQRLAELLLLPRELIVGAPLTMFVAETLPLPDTGTHGAADVGMTVEVELVDGNGVLVPVLVGISRLDVDCDPLVCLTFTDLSHKEAQDREIARLSSAQAVRMTELQEAQAALTEQATHDALTGLANRSVLVERIEQALSNSQDSGRCTAVFFVDLDRFKQVNDTRGHAAGDTVLRRVAAQLLSLLRPTDTVARIGGDEFVVLAPDIVSSAHALQLAARLAAELCRRPSRAEDGEHIAASIGIAFSVGGGTNAEALLHDADTAMYEAKSRGGARAVVYDTSFDEIVQQRSITQRMIALAIDEDRVVVHYQPILDLADLRIVGFEALARISDVDGVILPPSSFINVAEECGLIVPIGVPGARHRLRRGPAVAANHGRAPHDGRRQPLGSTVRARRPGRHHPAAARTNRSRPGAPAPRAHRDGDHGSASGPPRSAGGDQGTGSADRPRRLRYRLRIAHAPAPASPQLRQDRSVVRRRHRDGGIGRTHRLGRHRPRRETRLAFRRRRRRDRSINSNVCGSSDAIRPRATSSPGRFHRTTCRR